MMLRITSPRFQQAFSLVELSITLSVLGLLVGGIMAGQYLVRASQVRTVGEDYKRYVAATMLFREKYFYLPGDMPNATQFWGVQNPTCQITPSATTATCDGNGDGFICPDQNTLCYEMHRYWQHLANAGLITGTYTGVRNNPLNGGSFPGKNAPVTRFSAATFQIRNRGLQPDNVNTYGGYFGHVYFFGKVLDANSDPLDPVLTPTEASNVDIKFDDGKPGTGNITTVKAGATAWWDLNSNACAMGTVAATATYNLSNEKIGCTLYMRVTN